MINGARALRDVGFAKQDSARRAAAIALASDLGHDARASVQGSAAALVAAQPSINRLVTGYLDTLRTKVTDDLVRTPVLAQGGFDLPVDPLAIARAATAAATPRDGVAMRLAGSIAAIVRRRVATHFPAHRAWRAPQHARNVLLAETCSQMGRDQISFFLGELVIRHGCNPFLPDEVAASITAHPLHRQGVALSM